MTCLKTWRKDIHRDEIYKPSEAMYYTTIMVASKPTGVLHDYIH